MLLQTYRHRQDQRPLTTAHLAQTMTLLQLSGHELREKIEAELAVNPALEIINTRTCPSCHRQLPGNMACPVCTREYNDDTDAPIIFISSANDFTFSQQQTPPEEVSHEEYTANTEQLSEYVMRQIAPELRPQDRKIAAHILTSLDEDGLLTSTSLLEIAYYYHLPLSHVKEVLAIIQRSDPMGVGSATPREALLVQLDILSETEPVPGLAYQIIEHGLSLLSRHAYNEISKLFGVSPQEVLETTRFIKDNLNPYPARAHWGNYRHQTSASENALQPDIIINQRNNGSSAPRLIVEIIAPYTGGIRVNPLFRKALTEAPSDKGEKWQMDLDQAMLLIKCLQQRNNTMVRLMKYITNLQNDYILKGDRYLKAMTRAEIAEKLGVHESTISRAVSSKVVQLPNRKIIPLSIMFDRSLPIRAVIKEIISDEQKPLNDSQISQQLAKQGFEVARRTVAKYRSMEGILPARMRQ